MVCSHSLFDRGIFLQNCYIGFWIKIMMIFKRIYISLMHIFESRKHEWVNTPLSLKISQTVSEFPNLILECVGQRWEFWQKEKHTTEQVITGKSRQTSLFIWLPWAIWEELPTKWQLSLVITIAYGVLPRKSQMD